MVMKIINSCRLCGGQIIDIIHFGNVPLANAYVKDKTSDENVYPLTLVKCNECGHVQIKETIDPNILFSNYLYSSSDSPSLIKHFHEYAKDIISIFKTNNLKIIEIANNDGILLKEFENLGIIKLPQKNESSMGTTTQAINSTGKG